MSRLSLALEDAEIADDAVAADGTDLSVAEATVEAQAGAAEVTEAASDVETFDSAVAEASDDMSTIEQVSETVADSLDEEGPTGGEGMDPVAATLATETIERIRRKYRISSGVRSAPALESFKPRASRKEMTRLALESFSDTLKKMWERIKSFFRGLWDKIKAAVKSIFQSNIKTEKRAIELRNKVRDFVPTNTSKTTLDSSSIANAFNDNGKSNTASVLKVLDITAGFLGGLGDIQKVSQKMATETGDLIVTLGNIAKSDDSNAQNTLAPKLDALVATSRSMFNATGNTKGAQKAAREFFKDMITGDVEENKSEFAQIGPFYGGKYFVTADLVVKQDKAPKGAPVIHRVVSEYRSGGKEASKTIDICKKQDMDKVIDGSIQVAKAVADAERAIKVGDNIAAELTKGIDSVITMASTLASKNENTTTPFVSSTMSYVRELTLSQIKLVTQTSSVILSNALSSANTALDYVAASMKAQSK